MPNDNELCANCGEKWGNHRGTQCFAFRPSTVSVPDSLLDKVRALVDDFDNPDDMAPGTGRYYVDSVREALAEIEKGE